MKTTRTIKSLALALTLIATLVLTACGGQKSTTIQIAVPNDTTNEARALLLLEENGIIKLKEGAGITATKNDIVENPYNVEIVEAEAAQLPNILRDVDYAVINSNYAINAGLNPVADSLTIEGSSSAYSNILAVKEGNENNPEVLALIAALESKAVADFIAEKYAGAVVSTIANPTDGYDASVDYDALKDVTITVAASPTPHAEILEVARELLAAKGVTLKKADFNSLELLSHSLEGQTFNHGSRKALELPLLGEHQLHNAAVVLAIVDSLTEKGWKITEEQLREGLRTVSWPGRFHIVKRDPLFIVDGGHNPQCLESLVANIRDYLPGRRIIALTGVLADKDYGEMYKPVMPFIEKFVCITPPNDRKLESAELAKHLRAAGARAVAAESIPQGVAMAQQEAGEDGVVLCFGSLYSIGTIYASL